MLLRKYLLVTKSQVSRVDFILKKKRDVLFRTVLNIVNIVKADVVGVANRTVHNLVLEDGTQSCRADRLSYRAIEAVHRATIGQFKHAMSRQFQRNDKIWVRVLADLPIIGKPT